MAEADDQLRIQLDELLEELRNQIAVLRSAQKSVAAVACSIFPTTSAYLLLGLPPFVALQSSPWQQDDSAKTLAKIKHALQTLTQEFRDFKCVTNFAQNNHAQNFQPNRAHGFYNQSFERRRGAHNRARQSWQNYGNVNFQGAACTSNSRIICQNCTLPYSLD